ncbi:MAG: PilN domain-containing protein [Armatimonadota bacterium]
MRPFNLAESKIAERKYSKIIITKKIRLLMLMVMILIVAASVSAGSKMIIRTKATVLKTELAEIQEKNLSIKKTISKLQTNEARRGWQKNLNRSSAKLIDKIEFISASVPSDVWLNKIDTSGKEGEIAIDGFAESFDSISRFTNNLKRYPDFKEVKLLSTNVMENSSVSFSININTKQAVAEQLNTENTPQQPEGVE